MAQSLSADRVGLLWCSRKAVPGGWLTGKHCHLYSQLVFVDEGTLEISLEGASSILTKGACALIDPSRVHGIRAIKPCDLIEAKFVVHDETLLESLSAVPAFMERAPANLKDALLRIVREGEQREPLFDRIVSGTLEVLLCDLVRSGNDGGRLGPLPCARGLKQCQGNQPDLVLAVIQYFEARYQDEITLDDLGRTLGYNPAYICERFSEVVGRPPMRYLAEHRIEVSKELLKDTSLSIREVAWRVGFKSPSHFARIFRQSVGLSPRQFRKSAHTGENIELFFVQTSIASRYGINPDRATERIEWVIG